jgi:hypothetical protein
VRTPDGKLVRRLEQAPPGIEIHARLADGWIAARVTGARKQPLSEPSDLYHADPPSGSDA